MRFTDRGHDETALQWKETICRAVSLFKKCNDLPHVLCNINRRQERRFRIEFRRPLFRTRPRPTGQEGIHGGIQYEAYLPNGKNRTLFKISLSST